ncbi:replication/maintenance protein RepL [Candidatus Arsenophonus triatominarum]|uniref:Putative 20.9 kDa protein n=1 Tax=Triatoma infestans TaxID=30076 RepID=A0A023EXU4_TRIIF|nr:replication/maintenance protein RepL [Candidatus Arsenophonus triatominarum]
MKSSKNETAIRYNSNPFINNMLLSTKMKQIKVSRLGKDDNILVNRTTGEVNGTHVITYRKVDDEKFVKLFTSNIALTFDLKSAGIKAFNVLMWSVQRTAIDTDLVCLDKYALNDFLQENTLKMSMPTFWRGLKELEDVKVIAKARKLGFYYINPNFVFNGDRIAFTTAIEKIKK